ncbi:MAG: SWIM zinc finger family protein [Saprospiraceae bacterium]|nr:SWIM zinc finger family protein [Saprospiraceae bacterium]
MSFPLSDFKKYLSDDIIEKGAHYFSEGRVQKLIREGNTWTAEVTGTNNYAVIVYIKDSEISGWDCDCPYKAGPVCKHVAAVFFGLIQNA